MKNLKVGNAARACAHLSEMAAVEIEKKLADRYSHHGVMPHGVLSKALADLDAEIADFERSPKGESTRNMFVLALVRRTVTDGLREMKKRIDAARAAGEDFEMEQLRRPAA